MNDYPPKEIWVQLGFSQDGITMPTLVNEMPTAAPHYRLVPGDDARLVDEEWLESIELQDRDGLHSRHYPLPHPADHLAICGWPEEFPKQWEFAICTARRVVIRFNPTRGDIRRLFESLGLELKETIKR